MGGDFLPKVDTVGSTGTKEKLNVTHYYTQASTKLNENKNQRAVKGNAAAG